MTKKLDSAQIQNELDASAFFRKRSQETSDTQSIERDSESTDRGNVRWNDRTFERTNERSDLHHRERSKVRHSFDIYEDQLHSLRELQLSLASASERPSLGELVQAALDEFIEAERPNVRTNERTTAGTAEGKEVPGDV